MRPALGYAHNTQRYNVTVRGIPVTTIPDFVDHQRGLIDEIKDVKRLGWTRQLEAQYLAAQQQGYRYMLYVRNDTTLVGDLAADVSRGTIDLDYIDNYIIRETD